MDIFTAIEDSLQDAIDKTFTTLSKPTNVIISHEGGPEPKGSYVAINVLDITSQGQASKSGMAEWRTGSAKEYAVKSYEALVQLSFIGSEAPELAMLFHSQWKANTAIREHFLRNNLAPRTISNLRRAPQLRETVWVKSFNVDIRVGFTVRTIQDVDWVDYVVVNGNTIPLVGD